MKIVSKGKKTNKYTKQDLHVDRLVKDFWANFPNFCPNFSTSKIRKYGQKWGNLFREFHTIGCVSLLQSSHMAC